MKGDIVVIPFPFSDLSGSKRRPALVIANLTGDDRLPVNTRKMPMLSLLLQVTSKVVL